MPAFCVYQSCILVALPCSFILVLTSSSLSLQSDVYECTDALFNFLPSWLPVEISQGRH